MKREKVAIGEHVVVVKNRERIIDSRKGFWRRLRRWLKCLIDSS